jgi:hypothetical protein
MATADTAAKARIAGIIKKIEAAGLTPPTYPDDMAATDKEPLLRSWFAENKPVEDALQALRRRADLLGVFYDNDTSEEALSAEVGAVEASMRDRSKKHMEERKEERAMQPQGMDMEGFAKVLGKELGEAMKKKEKGAERVMSEREYDPNDLTEARTYFVPSSWWKLPMKRRGGQLVEPPFGKILFKTLESESVRVGDRRQVRYMCAYTTDSKAEQAYMETHELFNKSFFLSEDKAKVAQEDTEYALKFGQMFTMLLTYQAPDIYRMAGTPEMRATGLVLHKNMDLNAIRTELAGAMARNAVRDAKQERNGLLAYDSRKELLVTP